MRARLSYALVVLAVTGCNKAASDSPAPPSPQSVSIGDSFLLTEEATLMLIPSDDPMTVHPHDASIAVPNVVGRLFRGQKLTLRHQQPGWNEVVLPDDAEGWLHANAMLPAKTVQEQTVLTATPAYRDIGMKQLATTVQPGALLYVAGSSEGPVAQVEVEGLGMIYMQRQALVAEPQEVAMSHLIIEAKALANMNDPTEASETLDEARMAYPTSPLLDVIAQHVSFAQMHETARLQTSRFGMRR